VVGEFNVDKNHGSRSDWWKGIFATIESEGVAGDCFWWYMSKNVDGEYGIMTGDPELVVFKQHAAAMAAKSQ